MCVYMFVISHHELLALTRYQTFSNVELIAAFDWSHTFHIQDVIV